MHVCLTHTHGDDDYDDKRMVMMMVMMIKKKKLSVPRRLVLWEPQAVAGSLTSVVLSNTE